MGLVHNVENMMVANTEVVSQINSILIELFDEGGRLKIA